ncbi:Protein ZTF-16 a [Aphelenchoides avenae]|nr:Protein ZTF-16 a [Aphelenchus avenae]
MDAANVCACGFTSKVSQEFAKHVESHEQEPTSTVIKTDSRQREQSSSPSAQVDSTSPFADAAALAGTSSAMLGIADLSRLFSSPLDLSLAAQALAARSAFTAVAAAAAHQQPLHPSAMRPDIDASNGLVSSTGTSVVVSPKTSPSSSEGSSGRGAKTLHSCPHCNFTTYMSQHMKSHLEAHERHQGQMYQCDICHMQFSQKANMHRHRMRHSGVKPYQCRYCFKKFFRKDQMQEHSMTHIKTGNEFDCPLAKCDGRFSQHSLLKAHLDEDHTVTPTNQASCKRCSLMFSNSRRLLLHYQTKHDESNEGSGRGSKRSAINHSLNAPLDLSKAFNLMPSTLMPLASPVPKRRATVSCKPDASTIQQTASFMDSIASRLAASDRNNNGAEADVDIDDRSLGGSQRQGSLTPSDASLNENDTESINVDTVDSTMADDVDPQRHVQVTVISSPVHLPKSESPDYDILMGKTDAKSECIVGRSDTHSFNVESSSSSSSSEAMPLQLWTNEANSSTTTTVCPEESSSTHSPSADSRSSSTAMHDRHLDECMEQAAGMKVSNQNCDYCGIVFLDATLYLLHKGLHSDSDPWRCNLCGHSCSTKYDFHSHIIRCNHSN